MTRRDRVLVGLWLTIVVIVLALIPSYGLYLAFREVSLHNRRGVEAQYDIHLRELNRVRAELRAALRRGQSDESEEEEGTKL